MMQRRAAPLKNESVVHPQRDASDLPLVATARKTQRIPRSQRRRPGREFYLSPEAIAVLDALPPRERSAYVDGLILAERQRALRRQRRAR